MKYFIASDHAGVDFKAFVKGLFENKGHEVIDLGPDNKDRVDYPDFAQKVCCEVLKDNESRGVLICGTGIGMSMSANKFDGIRAGLCHSVYSATMAREHNDANILCLGARVTGDGVVGAIVDAWNSTEFAGGRHTNRVVKIDKLGSCSL